MHAAQCAALIAPYETALRICALRTRANHQHATLYVSDTGAPLSIDCTIASNAATVSTICSGVIG